jgi:tight adherence protein B
VSGLPVASLLLAAALLLRPVSSRHRLVAAGLAVRGRAAPARTHRAAASVVLVIAVVAVPATVVLAAAMAGGTLLVRRRRQAARRRIERDSHALEAALDVLVGELRAGAHPVAAFQVAAAEADGTVGASFRGVAARALLGADVSAGLFSVAAAAARPGQWERLAVCWQLAQTHGLTIATLLRAAQRDIVERARFDAQVSAGMAGARATATVLAVLPLAGVALGELLGAQPVRFLVTGAGGWLLLIGVSLVCCGLLWSDRITGRALS